MTHGEFRTAKIKSTCSQSGQPIRIGEIVFFSYLNGQEYSLYSKAYKKAQVIKKDYIQALKYEENLSFLNH